MADAIGFDAVSAHAEEARRSPSETKGGARS